ncbi:unnamed protein product, partial [Schistosoma haematobium]
NPHPPFLKMFFQPKIAIFFIPFRPMKWLVLKFVFNLLVMFCRIAIKHQYLSTKYILIIIMEDSNVPSTSAVVSHVTEIEEVFLTTLFLVAFPSIEALKSAITNYERSTYCHYVVRDSHLCRNENSYIKFVCWRHGRITSSGSSQRIRRRRASMNTECPAFMYCKIIDGYWTVVRGNVHHNHECNSLRYQGNSWVRRLTEAQFENVRPLLISGTASFHIKNYAYHSYGKLLTDQDIYNMRYKVFSQANIPGDYGKLKAHITSLGGRCEYELDDENCLSYFFFSTGDQKIFADRFGDVIGLDGTYKTNNENIYLYQVVALDMNLKAIPVCIAFISRETSTLISRFLSFFQRLTNSRQVVGIVTDDSPAIAAAIMQVYPNAHHILCRVHLVRNVIKRRVRSEVIQLFFRLMFTQTVESFNNVLSLIEISDGTFARYVRDHLLARKHKWSTAFRPSATLLQLNNTNFVETSHRILKMHQLSRKTPVLRSIFSVLLRVGYWMEARLQKYTSDCRVKAN